jgi:carboxymethylenebutenolidase
MDENRVRCFFTPVTITLLLVLCALGAPAQAADLPPKEADAKARLMESPRHGEWVKVDAGGGDLVDAWVVYP